MNSGKRYFKEVNFLIVTFLLVFAGNSSQAQEITIADFEGGDYGDWTTAGTAFGSGPSDGIARSDNGGNSIGAHQDEGHAQK